MLNLQTNEALLQHFQVEELEERLENKWGGSSSTHSCTTKITTFTLLDANNNAYPPKIESAAFPNATPCPSTQYCIGDKPGGSTFLCR